LGIIVIAISDNSSGINQSRIATVVLSIDNFAILDSANGHHAERRMKQPEAR
jgi:hypothetical protein